MPLSGQKLRTGETSGPSIRFVAQQAQREREYEKAAEKQEEGYNPGSMREWAELVPERGKPLNFDRFPYQEEWYSDEVARLREVVWKKAAQVGMSNYAIRWGMRQAEHEGNRVIYFMPTDDDVTAFGDQRIEPSIQESPFLQSRIPAHFVRNKHLKRIGLGDLSLRGTQSKSAVQSVDADALVFDEYDYLHQANLEQAERRLAGAQAAGREPRVRRLGYPTLPDYGIDALYERSDKRVWHVTCPECGEVQDLKWEQNMRWRGREDSEDEVRRHGHDEAYEDWRDVAHAWRACKRCEASLDVDEFRPIREGRWIPTRPHADLAGYHVPRLIVPYTDLIELVRNSRKTKPSAIEAFFNNDLGLAYVPAEAALTEQDVKAASAYGVPEFQTQVQPQQLVVCGLDVASERDLSIWFDELTPDGFQRSIYIGEPRTFEEAEQLIRRFRPQSIVVDSMPERRAARGLAAKFPGITYLAAYDDNNASDAFRYDPKKNLIMINRTEAIDAFMDGVRQRRRVLPSERAYPPRFVSQLLSPKRRTELDTKERPKRVYVSTGSDGDDYTHAGVYGLVAKEMYLLRAQVEQQQAQAQGAPVEDPRLGFREDGGYDRFEERY